MQTWRNLLMMITGNFHMLPSRLLAAVCLCLFAHGAAAQYVWIDAKGSKQFSDRPPPPSVPAKNILKQPAASVPQPPDAGAPPTPGGPTLAEREADYRQRAHQKAERDSKAAEQARSDGARRQHCAAARAYLAQLTSGERIRTVGASGERGVMDEAQRASETAAGRRVLAGCGGA